MSSYPEIPTFDTPPSLAARIEFLAGIGKLEAYLAKCAAFAAYLERTGRA